MTEQPRIEPQPTPAGAWIERWNQTKMRELSPGAWMEVRSLPLTDELVHGTLRNQVLEHVLPESWDLDPLDDPTETYKQRYEGYEPICVRAAVAPKVVSRLRMDERRRNNEPELREGEIPYTKLSYIEARNLVYFAVKEAVPPAGTAPFPARQPDHAELSAVGSTRETVRTDAEPVPAPAGG